MSFLCCATLAALGGRVSNKKAHVFLLLSRGAHNAIKWQFYGEDGSAKGAREYFTREQYAKRAASDAQCKKISPGVP